MNAIIIFVNGYWSDGKKAGAVFSKLSKQFGEKIQQIVAQNMGKAPKESYWHKGFISYCEKYFATFYKNQQNKNLEHIHKLFIDGKGKINSSGKTRFKAGYESATNKNCEENILRKLNDFELFDKNGKQQKQLYIVTHSMGTAFAEGMLKALMQQGIRASRILHFACADNSDFEVCQPQETYQINIVHDIVLLYKNAGDSNKIAISNFTNTIKHLLKNAPAQKQNLWQINKMLSDHYIEVKNGYKMYNHRYSKSHEIWEMCDWLKTYL